MLDDFASAGNRFGAPRAGDWNALRRAAQAHERHGLSVPGRPLGNALRPGTVRVKNELPFDLPRRRILGIDGMLATTDDDVVLRGTVPTPGQHAGGRWVVTAEPIAAGAIGRAWAYGVAKVPVNVVDFAHGFADVVQVGTVTYVTSTPGSGARILHPATEPGEQLMAVCLGGGGAGGGGGETKLSLDTPVYVSDSGEDAGRLGDFFTVDGRGTSGVPTLMARRDAALFHKRSTPAAATDSLPLNLYVDGTGKLSTARTRLAP